MKVEFLSSLSIAQLVSVYNQLAASDAQVKSFRTKAAGVDRIEKLDAGFGSHYEVELTEDGDVTVELKGLDVDPKEDAEDPEVDGEGDAPEGNESEGDEGEGDAPEAEPFVKASKEELAAMDGPTRADYRKRRRAAARAIRKARAAS